MRFDKDCQIIWHDRKRYFGLPISFTRYYLVKKEGEWVKLFRHKGFLSYIIDEVNIYRCFDITLIASLGDKIFKTGTLDVSTGDESTPNFVMKHIANPYKVRDLISSLIEFERKKRRIGITEFQNTEG